MASAPESAGTARIGDAFAGARAEGRAALMPYMMACYPDREASLAVADGYVEGGADLIELGVPFSDPLADGPVIHAAATAALEAGATLAGALEVCRAVSGRIPVVLMCYANMVLARGTEEFAAAAAGAGAAGAIVPDLALEESHEVRAALDRQRLALVPLIAPTTPPQRRRRICELARGFVYVVSDVGVTGERAELAPRLARLVEAVREESEVPAAVGFGIGSAEQAAAVGAIADGVIIGSRLVRAVAESPDAPSAAESVRAFLAGCRQTMAVRG